MHIYKMDQSKCFISALSKQDKYLCINLNINGKALMYVKVWDYMQ